MKDVRLKDLDNLHNVSQLESDEAGIQTEMCPRLTTHIYTSL
jgi:hypothetical protein